jgi:hypothetical protein
MRWVTRPNHKFSGEFAASTGAGTQVSTDGHVNPETRRGRADVRRSSRSWTRTANSPSGAEIHAIEGLAVPVGKDGQQGEVSKAEMWRQALLFYQAIRVPLPPKVNERDVQSLRRIVVVSSLHQG